MNPLTVSEINTYVKAYIEKNVLFSCVFVKGEISNFKRHSSGHFYMSLKDDNSVIKAVMFKYQAMSLKFEPENGMKVIVNARLSAYERDGIYQLYINEMQPDGLGSLHLKFEQLKSKLEKEGLFAASHKKRIPRIPSKIGIITSPTGAALKDILNVIGRRYPCCEIIVYPAQVQGEGAYETVVRGLHYFEKNPVDTVIIGRGGGSIEDLWCFNEEKLARAVYNCSIPVISAVGHETDYVLTDFVADLRAPTPSAAAELAVPSVSEIMKYLYTSKERIRNGLLSVLLKQSQKLEHLKSSRVFRYPGVMLETKLLTLSSLTDRLSAAYTGRLTAHKERVIKAVSSLDALSPLKILKRGYAFAQNKGVIVDSIKKLNQGDEIELNLSDGNALCVVSELKGE